MSLSTIKLEERIFRNKIVCLKCAMFQLVIDKSEIIVSTEGCNMVII